MSPLTLALAALAGGLLGAPVWILAWEWIRPHLPAITTAARAALRRRDHARTMPRASVRLTYQGRHATPRGGTPIVTPAQIATAERTAPA